MKLYDMKKIEQMVKEGLKNDEICDRMRLLYDKKEVVVFANHFRKAGKAGKAAKDSKPESTEG